MRRVEGGGEDPRLSEMHASRRAHFNTKHAPHVGPCFIRWWCSFHARFSTFFCNSCSVVGTRHEPLSYDLPKAGTLSHTPKKSASAYLSSFLPRISPRALQLFLPLLFFLCVRARLPWRLFSRVPASDHFRLQHHHRHVILVILHRSTTTHFTVFLFFRLVSLAFISISS